ncbi:MAG: MFS transporter, partial [Chloroflexi bacterium]|nr:MFS transporter [Chloroflexota bacterium]
KLSDATPPSGLNLDFWKFWVGQTISNLGSSFTAFALPLLIYKLTGSALNLALATAAAFLPYLLFGLLIGAWVDRLNRKRLMIVVDLINAGLLASIPLLATLDRLPVWWIYVVGFVGSTVGIAFQSAEFAAIPSLVNQDDLVTANGRIQASYSAAGVVGPLLAGVLIAVMPLYDIIFFDALSFVVSAFSLLLIRRSFNTETREERTTNIRQDVMEGLRYVIGHPVLRNISLMMALVNFVGSTTNTQLVLFAQQRLHATDSQVGYLYSAGSLGIVLLALLAGVLRKRWSFSTVALGALMVSGLLQIVFSLNTGYWVALVLWALYSGLGILFNINTGSLRQAIVPNHMLGRVMSIAGVLAWSAIPVGTFIGGLAIEKTGNVALVYTVIGVLVFLIPLGFWFTPLGHAERYLPAPAVAEGEESGQPVRV